MFPVGGAEGDVWPGVPEPAGAVLPAGACCATTQVAQNKSTDNSVSFLVDIMRPPALNFWRFPLPARESSWCKEPVMLSVKVSENREYPWDAVCGGK